LLYFHHKEFLRILEKMKPNDENGKHPISERPFRVPIISASNRCQYNSAIVDSNVRPLMFTLRSRESEGEKLRED